MRCYGNTLQINWARIGDAYLIVSATLYYSCMINSGCYRLIELEKNNGKMSEFSEITILVKLDDMWLLLVLN